MQQSLALTDEELCRLARSGKVSAIGELWERHSPIALAWAKKKDPVHGEDAVADAFDAVFHALMAGGGPETSFRGYLFRTINTQLIRRWGKQNRNTSLDESELELADLSQPSSIEMLSDDEQQRAAARAFAGLPARWQEVIQSVDVDGTRVKDYAEQVGMTQNAATVLLKRAREGLRRSWLGHMHPSRDLSEDCASAVSLFSEMRWGRRNSHDRKGAETHVDSCAHCGWRWRQFMGQASLIGLASAGMIGLFQGWSRRFAKPAVASAASVAMLFALGLSLSAGSPSDLETPITPVEPLPVVQESPEPPAPSAPSVAPEPAEAPDPAERPAPFVPRTPVAPVAPPHTGPAPAPPITYPSPAPAAPDEVLFGDWSDWCEPTQSFTLDCSA